MLNSIKSFLFIFFLCLLASCMPQQTATQQAATGSAGSSTTTTNSNANYQEPSFPYTGLFLQEGATRTNTVLSLPANFSDSFLVRGKDLSKYLRGVPNTTVFCVVGKYNYNPGIDKFLVLSAKPKSFTDFANKTTEFYLQVEPANDQTNQNDCLSYNLSNVLFTNASSPSLSFSFSQLCTDCTTSVTSGGLSLYFINGQQVPTLNISSLSLTISGNVIAGGNSCAESTTCMAKGYDCCLEGQCVSDGAVKPDAISQSGFVSAQEDVRLNPARFVVYPQFYFVCSSRPSSNGSGTSSGTTAAQADYEASVRLLELTQLYQCLNQVDGEFSYCTMKFTQASKQITAGTPFTISAGGYKDDVNFTTMNTNFNAGNYSHNIVKITYAGQTLYEMNKTALASADGSFVTTGNDDLSSAQSVLITKSLPSNALDDNLYLTYKVDGTCEKIGTTLAKCIKTFVQASSTTTSTKWHNNSSTFYLPAYADLSSTANVIVKVSGLTVPEDATTWTRYQGPNRIIFNASYPLYQNQDIEITYYVTSGVDDLLKSKTAALAQVNSMCNCGTAGTCNLKPVYGADQSLTNYECVYPTPTSQDPPANQTVLISNKNVPHRYFDLNGVNYDGTLETAPAQELTAFSYTNNDTLKPNNVSQYVGFNEIYGSFKNSGNLVARPAKTVSVKKDTLYDIYVNSGAFSSCLACGTDYYTVLQRIFPQNFSGQGGGYSPDNYESRRESNASIYRPDDLLYGRACFVPATMIPWTHIQSTTVINQRQTRLAGQHFLFANGYSRDWYGFDYGSIIGSFDGVTWFSVGNQRRIRSSSKKLFLAVNAYYGDLNVDNSFSISISETTPYSSSIPDHDTKSDGAECQKSHYCSNDNDCFTQLGYDYYCQSVAGLTTSWPIFDANANEVIGSATKSLSSIVGGTNGQVKRCVYRGRGAPCLQNLASSSTNFNGTSMTGTLMCSTNNSCQATSTSRFNDSIARFGNTPSAQNTASAAPTVTDTVGLGARVIGRPFDYYGTDSVPALAQTSLTQNLVSAICAPGKDISASTTTWDLNLKTPTTRTDKSDKILGIGVTLSGTTASSKYLAACPATDSTGTLVQITNGTLTSDANVIAQNLSSNLLDLTPLSSSNIYSSTNGSQITSVGYQRNTCLRAPGASCFSDMDCGPSSFMAARTKPADLSSVLNTAEEKFWEEELVCGNPDFKYVSPGAKNPNFDLKKNVCCREFGKTMTVYTETDFSAWKWCTGTTPQIAGINTTLNDSTRYSRAHSIYDSTKYTCDSSQVTSTKTFALSIAASSTTNRWNQIYQQYKTLDDVNSRACCTKHWVRSFATENGGGHAWSRTKQQTVDKAIFKKLNWLPDDTTSLGSDPDQPFECDPNHATNNSTDVTCEIRNFTAAEQTKYLEWAGSLELIGIPQVPIMTNDQIFPYVDDSQVSVGDTSVLANRYPLTNPDTGFVPVSPIVGGGAMITTPSQNEDFKDPSNYLYYSAASTETATGIKFGLGTGKLKKVFSENEFNCCIPSGQIVPTGTTAEQCCTGYLATNNNSPRCCLPDYTDVTAYLNRYVSSEGRGLPDSSYDPRTGYIKDPTVVNILQAQKNLCCSGQTAVGVAISDLHIPFKDGNIVKTLTTRRFVYRDDVVDNNTLTNPKGIASRYDAGVKWNNHLYCVPAGYQ